MTKRFVPPRNWPASPPRWWQPPAGWHPDRRWSPAPFGWQVWQEKRKQIRVARHKYATTLLASPSEPMDCPLLGTVEASQPSRSQLSPDRAKASASPASKAAA